MTGIEPSAAITAEPCAGGRSSRRAGGTSAPCSRGMERRSGIPTPLCDTDARTAPIAPTASAPASVKEITRMIGAHAVTASTTTRKRRTCARSVRRRSQACAPTASAPATPREQTTSTGGLARAAMASTFTTQSHVCARSVLRRRARRRRDGGPGSRICLLGFLLTLVKRKDGARYSEPEEGFPVQGEPSRGVREPQDPAGRRGCISSRPP